MKEAGRWLRGALHWGGVVLLGVLVLVLVVAGGLALRLSRGPMDVSWAVRTVLSWSGAGHVSIGDATLGWSGWQQGAGSPVQLTIRRLDVAGPDGATGITAAEGNATLSTTGLLTGAVQPQTAELRGVHLRAQRDADGTWRLLRDSGSSAPGGGDTLDKLRRLSLQDATVDVDDARLGPWRLANVQADLTRDEDGGLHGDASADAAVAGVSTRVTVHATVQPGGASRIEVSAGPIDPADIAAAAPGLAPATALDAPVSLSGTVVLDRAFHPVTASATVAATGAGRLAVLGGTVAFDSLSASGSFAWSGGVLDRVEAARVEAVLPSGSGAPPTRLVAAGSAAREGDRVKGTVTVDLDQVALGDLPRIWPPDAARNARDWITENITAGTLRAAHFAVTLDAPSDLSDVDVTGATGQFRGEDATVHWLRPVPPVEHVTATLSLENPDTMNIVLQPGALPPLERTADGNLSLGGGSIRLTGLSDHDQFAAISLDLAGTVPATIALLRHPRLKLLSTHPLPFRSAAGNQTAHLDIRVPLKKDVAVDDIPIRVDMRLSRLRLMDVVAHRDITNGELLLHVSNDGLALNGRVTVAGLPGTLGASLDFRAGPPSQVLQTVTFATRPTAAQLAAAGAPVAGRLTGGASLDVSYQSRRDGAGQVALSADLREAGLDLPGWRKAPGAPADVQAHAVLDHDRLQAVDALSAKGPGLLVRARAEMAAGQPTALVLEQAELGRTRASGRVGFGTPLTVSATGAVLDLSPLLEGGGSKGTSPGASPGALAGGPGTPFVLDASFATVVLGPNRALVGVAAHAEHDGHVLRRATLESSGPERVAVRIAPDGPCRTLHGEANDAGALLRVLDVTDRIETGRVTVDGRFDDRAPGSPLVAALRAGRLHILGAPSVGKLLQAVTVYGIIDALRGPGLVFSGLDVPFRYDRDRLEITDARLVSASLGATASGRLDFGRRTVDMAGTIVPAYVLNAAPGRIPLIGRLFSAEKAGGLFAAGWKVRGPLDDPSVSVNPFTLLAPGLLRRLFTGGDAQRPDE